MSATTQQPLQNTPQPYSSQARNASSTSDSESSFPPTDSRTSVPKFNGAAHDQDSAQSQTSTPSQPQTPSQGTRSKTQAAGAASKKDKDEGYIEPAEDEGGAARGTGTGAGDAPPVEPEGGYPEQRHAGKLDGPGPEYNQKNRATMGDKLQGLKEEVKGTIKRDPQLKGTGKERMTGELKRKEYQKEDVNPFDNADDDAGDKKSEGDDAPSEDTSTHLSKTETGLTDAPAAHPTEKGREEQAAYIRPDGKGASGQEKKARSNASNA